MVVSIPYTLAEVFIAFIATIGNGLVLYVFVKEKKQLEKKTNCYLASLALSDLLMGLVGIPLAIFVHLGEPKHLTACIFNISVLLSICTTTILTVVAICFDRFCMVVFPLSKYSMSKNSTFPTVIILLCWLIATLIGFMPLMGWHSSPIENEEHCLFSLISTDYLVFLFFTTALTPMLLLVCLYIGIYITVRKQARHIAEMINSVAESSQDKLAREREMKLTKNLIIIVVVFIICWAPIHIKNFIVAYCSSCPELHLSILEFFILISHMNAALNPFLYAYRLRDFRCSLRAIFPKVMNLFTRKKCHQETIMNDKLQI